jgi:hypothetical protein
MKAVLSLLALAVSTVALVPAQVVERGQGHGGHETTVVTYETTTVCPVTITTTGKGTTYEVTKWTTSTITVTSCAGGPCGGEATVTVPGPTVTKETGVTQYTTITSLCPVTETKTVGGSTVVVTWTSTSIIKTVVPTTVDVYTTKVTTEYETTDVFVTTTCPVTTYTTIVKGSTVEITQTDTKTLTVTKAYTVTEVIPVTLTKAVETTVEVTIGAGETVTQRPTVYVTVNGTVSQVVSKPPTTVIAPTTISTTAAPTTSSPVVATPNAAFVNQKAPAVALVAGLFGAVVLI